ncbi:MAG TPA: LamG domain-containing protein, partial [Candidatus Pacearchaeota archaeon]|nr:LamG domain-containing protein [Candidatus Pacearchaeota archaeon]
IEILVVIVVIGVLSAFVLVGISSITNSANINKSKAFSDSVRNSLLIYLFSELKLNNNANDSWKSNNGTLYGSPLFDIESNCIENECLIFDGNNDYIDLGNNPSLVSIFDNGNKFTYSLWFYPVEYPNTEWQWLVCKAFTSHISPYYQIDLRIRGGSSDFRVVNCVWNEAVGNYLPSVSSGNGSIKINTWNYVVATVDLSAKENRIYLNGVLKELRSGTTGTYSNYNTPLTIGIDKNIPVSPTYAFNGKIDNFNLYSDVIPSSKIKENYYLGLSKLFKDKNIILGEFNQRLTELKSDLVNQ